MVTPCKAGEVVWMEKGKGIAKNNVVLTPIIYLLDKMNKYWIYQRLYLHCGVLFENTRKHMLNSGLYVPSCEFGNAKYTPQLYADC